MNIQIKHPLVQSGQVRIWASSSPDIPAWVRAYMAGSVEPNGTFLIHSFAGIARVHVGHLVLEARNVAYTCSPPEKAELLDRIQSEIEAGSAIPVGPGKRLDRSGAGPVGTSGEKGSRRRKMAYRPPNGTRPSIEWVHVGALSFDPSYQRSVDNEASRRLINGIAANFDWRLCTPLVVARRSVGQFVVIDGQHRTMAARLRGDIDQLPCCLFSYADPQEEARMFIAANRSRKPMNRLDDFHAALAAADEDAIEIQTLVHDAGLRITRNTASNSWRPREIAFTASIASSLRKHGPAVVSAALTNLSEAFPEERLIHGGSIFLGLVRIFARPPENFDPDLLFSILKSQPASEWGSTVAGLKGGDTRAAAVRDILMAKYREASASTSEAVVQN